MFRPAACLAALVLAVPAARSQTAGTATLRFTTVDTRGEYAPRHVLAVWVTDEKYEFVRTLAVHGTKHRRALGKWREYAGDAKVDGVSGATRKAHGPIEVAWDGRDAAGKVAPDGRYRVFVEFTDRDGPGPVSPPGHLLFTKGPQPVTLSPPDLPALKGIRLVYAPAPSR